MLRLRNNISMRRLTWSMPTQSDAHYWYYTNAEWCRRSICKFDNAANHIQINIFFKHISMQVQSEFHLPSIPKSIIRMVGQQSNIYVKCFGLQHVYNRTISCCVPSIQRAVHIWIRRPTKIKIMPIQVASTCWSIAAITRKSNGVTTCCKIIQTIRCDWKPCALQLFVVFATYTEIFNNCSTQCANAYAALGILINRGRYRAHIIG